MQPSEYEISDGYVGSFGVTYEIATDATLTAAIEAASQFNDTTASDIVRRLEYGQPVRWRQSPNYYYDHSHGIIRRRRSAPPVQLVRCSCGHSVPARQVMNASLGTSCPDCYDRMSD